VSADAAQRMPEDAVEASLRGVVRDLHTALLMDVSRARPNFDRAFVLLSALVTLKKAIPPSKDEVASQFASMLRDAGAHSFAEAFESRARAAKEQQRNGATCSGPMRWDPAALVHCCTVCGYWTTESRGGALSHPKSEQAPARVG
jgi:hypothetical protein